MIQEMVNKVVGRKYISVLRAWIPNLVAWGTVAGVTVIHFTDWRLFLNRVPYIRGKFDKDE